VSTALGIAAVTAVLKDLLNNGVINNDIAATVGEVAVTSLPPDRIDVTDGNERNQLNLFLYQVTPNAGWRNIGLPSRDARGERTGNPPLALDLHYMLTAYGTRDLHHEILLGYGMQLLHETPVLPRDAIRRSLRPPLDVVDSTLPARLRSLFDSQLAEQIEQIKIVPQSLTTEEISRLWTAFQARYRPTAAFQVSVVLIESRRTTRTPLPVRDRLLYVVPFKHPVIEEIRSQAAPGTPIVSGQPILSGYTLVIDGQDLRGEDTVVTIDGDALVPTGVDDARVTVGLPASLGAGVHGVQVVHRLLMGSPPVPHEGITSNVAAFVLQPSFLSAVVSNVQNLPGGLRNAIVTVNVTPAVFDFQRVSLLLNEINPPAARASLAYSFPARRDVLSPPGATTSIEVPLADVLPASYLSRLQVDGAHSPLSSDATGAFVAPQVVVP
jgi:hypothetical protein